MAKNPNRVLGTDARPIRNRGLSREKTVNRIASEFDVAETTIRNDLRNMNEWVRPDPTGAARIRELRETRSRLYHLALDARKAGDVDLEQKIVRDLVSAIRTDVELCQSLRLTDNVNAAGEISLPEEIDSDDLLTYLGDHNPAVVSTSR